MENMNGQAILNGQGHLKSSYSHEERIMKNGSSGSNSSKYWFISGTFSILRFPESKNSGKKIWQRFWSLKSPSGFNFNQQWVNVNNIAKQIMWNDFTSFLIIALNLVWNILKAKRKKAEIFTLNS